MKNILSVLGYVIILSISGTQEIQSQYRQYSSCEIGATEYRAQLKLYGYEPSYSSISNCGRGDEEVPFEFRIYFNNMTVLLNMQRAIEAAQRAAVELWLREQENNFMKEINRQLGTKHSSFKSAQKDFFTNFERNFRGVENNAQSIGASHNKKAQTLNMEQEQNTNEFVLLEEWKNLRDICRPLGIINCPERSNTIVRGTRLGSATTATLDRLWAETLADFSDREYGSAQHWAWSQGMYKMINERSLISEMVNKHIAYYDRRNLQDKVFLMTAYLVQHNNRGVGPMSVPISSYRLPDFWSTTTLLEMGKKNAPKLSDAQRIFQENFFENEAERCNTMSSSYLAGQCARNWDRLADLKEDIVQEHIEEQLRYSEFGMTLKLNALREGYRKNNGAGRLAGLEALSYKNHSPDRSGPAANRFYELNNGGWVYRSNSPREVNGGVSFSEPTLNDDGYFYYIFNEDTKRWHELLLPAAGVSTTSDPYLVQAFWKGMKGVARYALPLEDAIILIDGKDFDGNQASEAEAGVLLIAGFVPGGKILKPVLRVVKGAKVWRIFTRQGGRTYITDLFKLAPLFKTGANRSFFWSGKTNGIGGVNRAMEIASSKGGTTLEGLIKSTNIDIPKWDLSNPQSVEAWKEVSRLYAEQASGEVRAIIGKDLRPDSLWELIELPALKKNKQVTKIITIDPLTLKEKIIFNR